MSSDLGSLSTSVPNGLPTLQQLFDPADKWQERLDTYRFTKVEEGTFGGLSTAGRSSFSRFHNRRWFEHEFTAARNAALQSVYVPQDKDSIFGRIAILSLATIETTMLLGTTDQSYQPNEANIQPWTELQSQVTEVYKSYYIGEEDGARRLVDALTNLTNAHMKPASWNGSTVRDFLPTLEEGRAGASRVRPSLPMINTAKSQTVQSGSSPQGSLQNTPVDLIRTTPQQESMHPQMSATIGPEGLDNRPDFDGMVHSGPQLYRTAARRFDGPRGSQPSQTREDSV